MLLPLFLLGIVAGAAIALPYGPVGFVIIRRFYLFGMKSGMISALGTSISDIFYAVIVGFSLHKIQHFLLSIATYTEIGAGLVLIYLGVNAIRTKLALGEGEVENHPIEDIVSTFLINFLNPTMIFAFVLTFSILAKIVGKESVGFEGVMVFIAGIPVGTCLLWYGIGALIRHLRKNNRHAVVERINYYTGAILGVIGIVLAAAAITKFIF